MNGKFPPQKGYRHELAYGSNTPQECQGLDNTNDVAAHKGEVSADVNDGEISGDFSHNIWPPTAQNKETDKRHGFFSKELSPDCQGSVTVMAADFGNYSFHHISQHSIRNNTEHNADDDGERTSSDRRERYMKTQTQEKDEELKSGSSSNWMSVIKEALEMSNGIELEPDPTCSTSVAYEEPLPRGVEPVKDHFVSLDYRCPDVREESKTEANSSQDSSVLTDATKMASFKLNQDVQQREVDFLTDDSSMNDKVFKKTSYVTLEQCSTPGFRNSTEICTSDQYIPAEPKEVSGLTMRSCLSDDLSAVRTNVEEQSKNASDFRKNTEGTFLAICPQLRQMSKDDGEDRPRICVDSQAKHGEDYCSKGDNATLARNFHLPSKNLKLHGAQRPNLEQDCRNIQDNTDQRIWYKSAESKIAPTEDQKPGVSHSGFVPVKNSGSSNVVINRTNESSHESDLHLPVKHNVEHYGEHHSESTSTSVTKLENLVHNLYNMVPQGGSLNMTTNAEYTKTTEAPQKLVKNQKMKNKWDTAPHDEALDPSVCQQSTAEPGDLGSGKVPSTKANHHDFEKHDTSAEQMTENLAQTSEKQNSSPQEKINHTTTSEPQQNSLKNVEKNVSGTFEHVLQNPENLQSRQKTIRKRRTVGSVVSPGRVQNFTGRRKSSGYTPKANVEIKSFEKEGISKENCHTTSVSQSTRKKLKEEEKRGGPPKKTSPPSEEKLLVTSHALVPEIKQECEEITLTNEDKHAEQAVSQREDCLPLFLISDAQGSVKVKSHAKNETKKKRKKEKDQRSNDITFKVKEETLSCDISKTLDSLSVSEKRGSSVSPQYTTWKLKNSKIENKSSPLCSVQKGVASTDLLSASDCQFEEINSTPDVQNLEPINCSRRRLNKDIKSFSATIKSEDQDFLEEPVYSEADAATTCSVQNTLRKTRNSRNKAQYLQLGLDSPTTVKTSKEHAKGVNVNAKKPQVVKKKARQCAHLSAEIRPSRNFENSFQPEEIRDYLKKLRQRASTFKTDFVCKSAANNVKLEPDFYPITCEYVSDFSKNETVLSSQEPHKDCAPKSTKNEQKMDHDKSSKTHVMRKKRAGHSKRRKQKKFVKSGSTVHEPLESVTPQDIQYQNHSSKHPITMEENTPTGEIFRRSCRIRQNNQFSSVQTHPCISLVLSHTSENSAHEQTILSHPEYIMDTADSEKMSSGSALSSARQMSSRRPIKKVRQLTRSRTSMVQTDKAERENLDSVKQASLTSKSNESPVKTPVAPVENDVPPIQASCLARAENEIGSRTPTNSRKPKPKISSTPTLINFPQAVPAHSKKRVKKSKPHFSVLSLRYSRRLSKFNRGSRYENSGLSAVDERISLRTHSAVSQQAHMDIIKPRKNNKKKVSTKPSKHKKKKDAQNKSKLRGCGDVKGRKPDKDGSFVSCKLRGHQLNLSKENVRRLAMSIPHKTGNLKREKIAQDQTTVTSTKKLDNSSIAKSRIRRAESHEENCGQKRRKLRPPPVVDKHEGNAHVKTTFKNKRKQPQMKTGQISKRKPSSSRVNNLQNQSCKRLLNHFKDSPKTPIPKVDHNLRDVELNSTNDCNKTLLNTETEDVHSALSADLSSKSVNKDVNRRESKRTRLVESKNEERLNTESNGCTTFELSMQSPINSRGFISSELCDPICDQEVNEEMSEELVIDASIRASDLEILGRDVGVENSYANEDMLSQNSGSQNEERRSSDEDNIATHSMSMCALGVESSFANEGILQQDSGGQHEEGIARAGEDDISPLSKGTCVGKEAVKRKKVVSLPKDSAKKYIVCKYCGQAFRHISAYTVHQRIHTGEKPYRCKLCGKSFAQLSKLRFHRKIHMQPEVLCCPCCSKKFSKKHSLLSHFSIHLKESKEKNKPDRDIQCKPSAGSLKSSANHMCIICQNILPNKFMLKLHMHMHEEKPLSCKTCGKEFQKSSQLLVHEKTHWPVKPYACSVCGKGFMKLQALEQHSREHTGETPFSCYHCGHAFRDLSALRVHQVSERCIVKGKLRLDNCDIEGLLVSQGVDGQVNTPVFFKCKICRQIYQKWCQYTLHLETHTKSPPYLCVACGQTYEKNSEVTFHCKICCQYSGEEVPCNASLSEIFAVDVQKDAFLQNNSTLNPLSLQVSKTKNVSVPSESNSQEDSQTPDNALQKTDCNFQPTEIMETSSLPETVPLVRNDVVPINQHSGLPSPTPLVMTSVSTGWLESTDQQKEQYKSLSAHKQTHTPHFRHCRRSFEGRSRLGLNQGIHVKRRCYSCLQCNIQFRFFSAYKEHLLNHAGDRPFTCPVCPETFVRAQCVCIHQPSKILRCDVCAKTFINLRNLLKHCLLHSDAASFQCLSCKVSFGNNKILQEHLKTHNNSVDLQLPEIPSKPLAFPHKCKKCKASFSTGDLLYAHQTRHFRGQVYSPNVSESTSSISKQKPNLPPELPLPSTSRPLISTINLDAIPNDESLYTYPHPDKLYVMPSLSRRCLQIINLDSEDEETLQLASSSHTSGNNSISSREPSGQTSMEKSPICSEIDNKHLPQSSQSPKSPHTQSQSTKYIPAAHTPSYIEDKASQNSETETVNYVETFVFIEDPTTTPNTEVTQGQSESFECVDCSYKTSSLLGLHEHHFLHALGNRNRDKLRFL